MMEALSEVRGGPLSLHHSLAQMIREGARSNPSATAVSCLHQPVDHLKNLRLGPNGHPEHFSWSVEQLEIASLTVARSFRRHGTRQRSVLVSFLPNGVEPVIMQWVAALLELTYVPLDPEVLCEVRKEQAQFFLTSVGEVGETGIIVVPDHKTAVFVDDLLCAENGKPIKVVVAPDASESWISLAQVKADEDLKSDLKQDDETEEDLDRVAAILFTSGTSQGRPKGCPLTVRNVMAARANDWGMAEMTSSWLVTFLSFRIIFVGLTYLCGGTGREFIIPAAKPSPNNILPAIERLSEKQLTMITVPNLVRLFANDPATSTRDLTSLRRLLFGGDIANEESFALAQTVFPATRISTVMGMTEAGGVIGFAGGHTFLPTRYRQGISSIGKPGRGASVRIVDEKNRPVRRGQTGRLLISGPAVLQRYLGDVHPELFFVDDAGTWLDTGDVAVMEEAEEEFFIVGRTKDIIKRAGVSLSPAVLENVLQTYCGMDVSHSVVSVLKTLLKMFAGSCRCRAT